MKRREFIYSSAGVTSTVALAGCIDPENEPNDNSTNTPEDDENNDENDDPDDEENNNDENMEPTGITNGSFENGLKDWTVGKDLPDVPGGSEPVDSEVSISSERVSDGSQSVSIYIEGIADDGTVWVEQTVDLTDYDTFKIDAYS